MGTGRGGGAVFPINMLMHVPVVVFFLLVCLVKALNVSAHTVMTFERHVDFVDQILMVW